MDNPCPLCNKLASTMHCSSFTCNWEVCHRGKYHPEMKDVVFKTMDPSKFFLRSRTVPAP